MSATVVYPPGSATLQAEVRQFQGKRFGAVFIADNDLGRAGLLLRFMAREDIWTNRTAVMKAEPESKVRYVHIFGPSEWHAGAVERDDRRYLRGAVVAVEWPGAKARSVRGFVEAARRAFDREPGVFEAVGYDAIATVTVMGAAGRAAVAEKLRASTFKGVLGRLRFDKAGEPVRRARLYRVGRAGFELVK